MLPALKAAFLRDSSGTRGDIIATLFAKYAADQPDLLASLIIAAESRQIELIANLAQTQGEPAVGPLVDVLTRIARGELDAEAKVPQFVPPGKSVDVESLRAGHRANAAMALWALGRPSLFWPLLKAGEDPRTRTDLIRAMSRCGISPEQAFRQLRLEQEPTVRQAIVLGLGGYPENQLPVARRESLVPDFVEIYRRDPDPGVHSAVEWLLRQWGIGDRLSPVVESLKAEGENPGTKRWFVNVAGDTMVIVPGPTLFRMGRSARDPVWENEKNPRHNRRIDRTYAIASKEVTVRQFLKLCPGHEYDRKVAPSDDCPINKITWFDAARYCRKLSELAGMEEEEMCYPPVDQIVQGMVMKPDYLKRPGYRLPTEAEWEASERAGSTASRFYGSDPSISLLNLFSWNAYNSNSTMHPVGLTMPNQYGLFDMLGNAYDRCHDVFQEYPSDQRGPLPDEEIPCESFREDSSRVIRGGAFHWFSDKLRSASRHSTWTFNNSEYLGFRVVRTLK